MAVPQYFEPIEHPRAEEARRKGMTVEQLLEIEKKNSQPGVIIQDYKDAYQNQQAAIKNNPNEAARQKEGEILAKQKATQTASGILGMSMPSTYWNLFNLDNQLSPKKALTLDLGVGLLAGGIGTVAGKHALQKGTQHFIKRNYTDLFTNGPVRTYGKVKYYGPTMGKTTAAKTNLLLSDFDDIVRADIEALAKRKGVTARDLKINSDPDYIQLINDAVNKWSLNPANDGKTLMISNKVLSNPNKVEFIYDNVPSIPSRESFIRRNVNRGGTVKDSEDWYNALLQENPNLQLDDRFVETIERASVQQNKLGGKINNTMMNYLDFFKKGGGIHIKKENKGKFTDYCGGKVTEECIQKGKHSSNPAVRKRATFAANARKWKHDDGGKVTYFKRSKINTDDNTTTQYLPEDNSLYYKADNTYVVSNKEPYNEDRFDLSNLNPLTITSTEQKTDNKLHTDINGLLDLFNKYNIRVRVTSGYRKGAKTKQGKTSFHALGRAIDIVPEDGDFTKLAQAIKTNPIIKSYMMIKGLGIYDETTDDVLALTGGSGAHFHVGPDKIGQKFWQT